MRLLQMYLVHGADKNGPAILEVGTEDWSIDLYNELDEPDLAYHPGYAVSEHELSKIPKRTKMIKYETT